MTASAAMTAPSRLGLVEEAAVDMRDADEGDAGAVRQSVCRVAVVHAGCRHYIGNRRRIFAQKGNTVTMGQVEADDGILVADPVILDQRPSGPGIDEIVAGSAINGIGPASSENRIIVRAAIN